MNYATDFKTVRDEVSPDEWQARLDLADLIVGSLVRCGDAAVGENPSHDEAPSVTKTHIVMWGVSEVVST